MPLIFSRTRRNDFIGACNDVKAFIAGQGSLSTSVLVSDATESDEHAEKQAKSKSSLMNHSPSTSAVVSKTSLPMLVTRGFISQRHSSSSAPYLLRCQSRVLLSVDSHKPQENPDKGENQ